MAGKYSKKPLRERILEKCEIQSSGCIIWKGAKSGEYGTIFYRGKRVRVHRAMYIETIGSIPEKMCACHKCDTPLCVNHEHIFIGTMEDNNRDRDSKNRQSKGKSHSKKIYGKANYRINEKQVIEIRNLYRNGLTQRNIAKIYNMVSQHVSAIVNYKSWSHVNDLQTGSFKPKAPVDTSGERSDHRQR